MEIDQSAGRGEWESFLREREWSPFLQSFSMGEVYQSIGESPVRIAVREGGKLVGICQAILVPARRGRHLAVMYGPILSETSDAGRMLRLIVDELKKIAIEKDCSFIRVSPFWRNNDPKVEALKELGFRSAPLHLLAEHIWYLDLKGKTEEGILMGMRKTTRNLIRRAEKEGVTVVASDDPVRDLPVFFSLYEETRKRHHFVPYSEDFIRAQVEEFSKTNQCRLYSARYNNEPVASSVHMVYGNETSYHHGASTTKYPNCYASYLLQWTAIKDALKRGDRIYNFWGISPPSAKPACRTGRASEGRPEGATKHPFAGVRTFKTGFGGELLELAHCMDLPLSPKYAITFGIETFRKWKRGF